MKNYAEMSDFEINCAVAEALGLNVQYQSMRNGGRVLVVVKVELGVEKYYRIPDYCNDWEVAGPIIAENKISIVPHLLSDLWLSTSRGVEHAAQHENPLRASMIVFCMIHGDDQ